MNSNGKSTSVYAAADKSVEYSPITPAVQGAREFTEKWLGERFVTKYEGQVVQEVSVQMAIDLAKAYAAHVTAARPQREPGPIKDVNDLAMYCQDERTGPVDAIREIKKFIAEVTAADKAEIAKELVRYERDPNNGAGLWAVFVGEMPIHHFDPRTANTERYMARLRGEIAKFYAAHESKELAAKDAAIAELRHVFKIITDQRDEHMEKREQAESALKEAQKKLDAIDDADYVLNVDATWKAKNAEIAKLQSELATLREKVKTGAKWDAIEGRVL